MTKQLVTARIIVPDCDDWEEAEADVAVALLEAGYSVDSVKWEEEYDTEEEDDDWGE